jgi:hypothetical protein
LQVVFREYLRLLPRHEPLRQLMKKSIHQYVRRPKHSSPAPNQHEYLLGLCCFLISVFEKGDLLAAHSAAMGGWPSAEHNRLPKGIDLKMR